MRSAPFADPSIGGRLVALTGIRSFSEAPFQCPLLGAGLTNGVVNDGVPDSPGQSGENRKGLYRVHQVLAVPLTAVSIRVGVRDRMSDRFGTLEIPLPLKPEPVAQTAQPKP